VLRLRTHIIAYKRKEPPRVKNRGLGGLELVGVPRRITAQQQSALMRRVKSKNTKPELAVRGLLHRLGYRFRLHAPDLPGSPDIVLKSRKAVIFVHGCFWHGHGCRLAGKPAQSNTDYWGPKILRNVERDVRSQEGLERLEWRVLVVWECEVRDTVRLADKLSEFLAGC
jgi:DNA mismatch endonuclease (patch repair protein)